MTPADHHNPDQVADLSFCFFFFFDIVGQRAVSLSGTMESTSREICATMAGTCGRSSTDLVKIFSDHSLDLPLILFLSH